MFVIHFSICDLCVIVIMNVKCCVHVLHNVYQTCGDVLLSTFDPGPWIYTKEKNNNTQCEYSPARFLYEHGLFKRYAYVKSSIIHQISHLHTLYIVQAEKNRSVCLVSCSSQCPTNLEDKSLISRSADRIQNSLSLPEHLKCTNIIHRHASCVFICSH